MSNADKAMEVYQILEETHLKACRVRVTTYVSILDAWNKSESLKLAAIVGTVLKFASLL